MKKQIFSAVVALAAVAAMSVSAFAVDAGSSNGSDTAAVKDDGSVEFVSEKVEGLVVEADAGVFDADVELSVDVEQVDAAQVVAVEEAVADAVTAGTVKTSDGAKVAKFEVKSVDAVVDIKALLNGAEVQPDGSVAITVAKDANQTSNQAIYVDDNGNVEVLPTVVTDTTITFTTKHFSKFYLVTATVDQNGATDGDGNDKNQATGVVLAVIPAIAAASAIVVSKKRK